MFVFFLGGENELEIVSYMTVFIKENKVVFPVHTIIF